MAFNKFPTIKVAEDQDWCILHWKPICNEINKQIHRINKTSKVVVIECYPGVFLDEFEDVFSNHIDNATLVLSSAAMKSESEIREMTFPDVTDDRVFGKISNLELRDFFDTDKLNQVQNSILTNAGTTIILGIGASLLCDSPNLLVYADMARWEAQLRMRKNLVNNIGIIDKDESIEKQYKRAYFVDWRVCDKLKIKLIDKWDFVLDTNLQEIPKMTHGKIVRNSLNSAVNQPFSVVPFFDPGPWGGQWMREKFGLDPKKDNFAWCFNCVPEENSLLLEFSNTTFEIPSINLVFYKPEELLGPKVYQEFGAEFPIRFDFLDTMDGGNLSLQVHPLKAYIKENFNMPYTQDESYYMLDAGEDAFVYLGINEGIDAQQTINSLKKAQKNGDGFDADQFSAKWPAKKHDHFLIPAGTVHCSGKNCMILEISATPYIFTFKLWDWGRLGMDGRPRPISIEHGEKVIQWGRTSKWVEKNLINRFEVVGKGQGWTEEKTGLHELEFIETRRFWFDSKINLSTDNTVNVLMLIEGDQALVESPGGFFEPFKVNYGEAFIVPAQVGDYTIKPIKTSEGEKLAIIKAFVKPQKN